MSNYKTAMKFFVFTVFLIASELGASQAEKFDNDFFESNEIKLELEHSFTGEENSFTRRGELEVKNLKNPKPIGTQNDLSSDALKKLKEAKDQDGYYFLKIKATSGSSVKTFRTFLPAKTLLDSGLSDLLTLHINPYNELYAISYSAGTPNANVWDLASRQGKVTFTTSCQIHNGENGPVPDTAPYLEKIEQERVAKERGDDGRDNRSFLAKYWMYIVPVLVLFLVSSASSPEEGGR